MGGVALGRGILLCLTASHLCLLALFFSVNLIKYVFLREKK